MVGNPRGCTSSPMSSFHTSGWSSMKSRIRAAHSASSRSTISTPCRASQSCPPWKVAASPMTTREIPNWRTRPLQYQQGDRVVTIVVPRYERCRPAARKAAVSACMDGSPSWTRRLCPRPRSVPSAPYSAAPIGMPPSASPARASATAVAEARPVDVTAGAPGVAPAVVPVPHAVHSPGHGTPGQRAVPGRPTSSIAGRARSPSGAGPGTRSDSCCIREPARGHEAGGAAPPARPRSRGA